MALQNTLSPWLFSSPKSLSLALSPIDHLLNLLFVSPFLLGPSEQAGLPDSFSDQSCLIWSILATLETFSITEINSFGLTVNEKTCKLINYSNFFPLDF